MTHDTGNPSVEDYYLSVDLLFSANRPVNKQLQTAKDLIAEGVKLGYIMSDYKLIAHRQASATECPGEALFNEIVTWDHFTLI